ncbi:membrane protein [Streptomyces subrutilus]|uniref:DMT family transporter n=1 Tax=Streptomyces subrutilus TaxID=36818 RepID=A0A5P2UCQ7_9ACTN|nr:DMT family transporter [Streptomyces subrutilus]QEU77053.1 DMT family transporter [Streptomyces subrutilus]GGZ96318.1 membrane protein [Streptomyces subrutilus]
MDQTAGVPGTDHRALAAASLTVVLWASAFVSIRAAAADYSPGALALGRLLTASLALGIVLAVRRVPFPPRQAWPGILGSGILWFGLYMVALNWGEQLVDAGTAAMIVNIGPIVIALLSGWLLKEGFPPMLLAGMGVSFAGAAVVGLSTSGGGSSSLGGVLLCLVAALTYGAGVVSQKPALAYASPIQVTTYGCFVGTAVTLPFAGQLFAELPHAPLSATLNMVYLGLFPTALAFTTWTYALARTTAGRMGATTYAVPATVVLIAWLVLGEIPGWLTLLGGAICLAGVGVSRHRGRRPAPAGAPEGPAAS